MAAGLRANWIYLRFYSFEELALKVDIFFKDQHNNIEVSKELGTGR